MDILHLDTYTLCVVGAVLVFAGVLFAAACVGRQL